MVTTLVGFAIAVGLVGQGVVQLFRRRTPAEPSEGRGRMGAWSDILFGVGLALGTAARVPHGHRHLWDDVLLGPALGCVLVGVLLYVGPRRVSR
ncbi:hypothetical protein ACKI1I_31695 [Streptomyces turgidiscabies]|nr:MULTISPECIES: hypothetical protein [Streptomyces]MDX3499186.1 hypothetical protein [Streptomyces turgidiscabies]GAQ75612.1 hypothetical protein T45_07398 [Streptomyces turgidiscabies]